MPALFEAPASIPPSIRRLVKAVFYPDKPRRVALLAGEVVVSPRHERRDWLAARAQRRHLTLRHELPAMVAVLSLLDGEALFVDAGANVGVWAVAAAKLSALHPGLRVLAIEPQEDVCERLRAGLAPWLASGVAEVERVALSERREDLAMRIGIGSGTFGVASPAPQLPASRSIEAVPLDDLVRHRPGDIILKVDVEGHELAVLRGAGESLASGRVRAVFIDGYPPGDAAPIADLLRRHGLGAFEGIGLHPWRAGDATLLATRDA